MKMYVDEEMRRGLDGLLAVAVLVTGLLWAAVLLFGDSPPSQNDINCDGGVCEMGGDVVGYTITLSSDRRPCRDCIPLEEVEFPILTDGGVGDARIRSLMVVEADDGRTLLDLKSNGDVIFDWRCMENPACLRAWFDVPRSFLDKKGSLTVHRKDGTTTRDETWGGIR